MPWSRHTSSSLWKSVDFMLRMLSARALSEMLIFPLSVLRLSPMNMEITSLGQIDPNTVIDGIGGTVAVAKLCDLTSGAVSQWRHNGIPKAQLNYLRLARPDFFASLEAKKAA